MQSLDFGAEKAAFRDYYNDNAQRLEQAKHAFLTLLGSLIAREDLAVAAATGRIKDREESIKKFTRKYQGALEKSETPYEIKNHITDLIGLRLVCLYEDEIEPMGELVRQHFSVIEVTDKTAEIEGTENSFGYKGLHLDLRLDDARAAMPEYELFVPFRFELQIRTIVQDSWSTLDHKIKYKKSIPASLKRRINTLAALFELADREFRQVRDETERQIEKASAEPEPDAEPQEAGQEEVAAAPVEGGVDIERGQYAPLNALQAPSYRPPLLPRRRIRAGEDRRLHRRGDGTRAEHQPGQVQPLPALRDRVGPAIPRAFPGKRQGRQVQCVHRDAARTVRSESGGLRHDADERGP